MGKSGEFRSIRPPSKPSAALKFRRNNDFVDTVIFQMQHQDFYQRKIIILDSVDENEVLDFFSDFPILPSSEVFFFAKSDEEIFIKQIYRVSAETSLIQEFYGKYLIKNDSYVDLRSQRVTSRRRRNLMGIQINASLVVTNNETLDHLHDYQLS